MPTPRPRAAGAAKVKPGSALSERAIVEAAFELLSEKGVGGLTMRELSARLGVALGATYRHVRSKHDLVKLIAEDLYARIEPGDPDADGFAQAKAVMTQVHDLLGAYPGLAGYIGGRMTEFASTSVVKMVSDPLRAAGLSGPDAQLVVMTMTLYTSGHLLVRDSLTEWEGQHRERYSEGLDVLLEGARARVGRPTSRRRSTALTATRPRR